MAAIHQSNAVYWQKQRRTPEGEAEFQRRVTRLEQIIEELARLTEDDQIL